MTPELWQRLKQVYEPALELPVEERTRFIGQIEPTLRPILQRLLSASEKGTLSLDDPLIDFHQSGPKQEQVFSAGDLLLGRFLIVRLLSSGGMGEVYEAIDIQLGRIALKTLICDITLNPEQLLRFRKEVLLTRSVNSPNVVRFHELFFMEEAQGAFVTMELLEGITLADRIRKSGPLPWKEAQIIALEVCAALASIHDASVIHRDLKCSNIMLASRNGTSCTVLMDFGVARRIPRFTGDDTTEITSPGTILGTPGYMAPEQSQGKDTTPASDVYALGIVLYELVTGKRPVAEGSSPDESQTRTRSLVCPSSMQAAVPRRFDDVVFRCLEEDPQRRYQSAREVERAIRNVSPASPWQRRLTRLASRSPAF